MATYTCSYCNYKTTKGVKPQKCPYCSRIGTMTEVQSAENILEDL